ncbi:MAG: TRAP transporter small permease subunit [Spirochaetales bacterium]|nr:TRAP transporter small permease subunit [Spirochaetales bacterium]
MERVCRISETISRIVQKIEVFIGVSCLFLLFVLMIANTFGRYLLAMPIFWADELNNFLFVWVGFLGAAYIMGNDGHIRVTAIFGVLSRSGRFCVLQISNLIFLFMCAIFMEPCYRLLRAVTFSGIMRIPLEYIYIIIPLSFGFMGLHIINNMFQTTLRFRKKEL